MRVTGHTVNRNCDRVSGVSHARTLHQFEINGVTLLAYDEAGSLAAERVAGELWQDIYGLRNARECYALAMADVATMRSPRPDLLDQRVHLRGVTWDDYERLLELRGDDPQVRMIYLHGELEIMTPSSVHERLKKRLARLLEAWSEETGVDLEGVGSWTLRNRLTERGLEPDECYFVGRGGEGEDAPDFALEVVWTSGGIDKLTVYAGLGVREVWLWQDGRLSFHVLRYEAAGRSELLPELDPDPIARLMNATISQAQAIRDLRGAARGNPSGR